MILDLRFTIFRAGANLKLKAMMFNLVGRASSRAGILLIVRLAKTLAPPAAIKLSTALDAKTRARQIAAFN
jgi:hypothetical protein